MANPNARWRRTLRRYRLALQTNAAGRPLRYPRTMARLAAARFGYGLGPLLFSLYRLDRKPVTTWSTYIRDTPNKEMYEAINPPAHRRPLNDKLMFHAHCLRHGLATAPILALFRGPGLGDAFGVPDVQDAAHFGRLLAAQPTGLFVKLVDGAHGEGAFRVLHDPAGCLLPSGPASVAEGHAWCRARAASHTLLVQPRLVNAAALRPIMSKVGFGTVRVMTWLDGGEPRLMAATLRIITGDNVADNFLQGAVGNFVAPVDADTGRLAVVRTSGRADWPVIVDVPGHPATGLELPYWRDLLDLVFRAHRAFEGLRVIGWDVGITDDGPLLVEGNAVPDCDLIQIAFDRGFKPDFERIVGGRLAGQPAQLPL